MRRRMIIFAIIVAILIIPSALHLKKTNDINQQKHRWLINSVSTTVYGITSSIGMINSEDNAEELQWALSDISHELLRLHYLLEDSAMMMSQEYYYSDILGFEFLSQVIDGTAYISGVGINGTAFIEDNIIDAKEAELLRELDIDLMQILEVISVDGMNGNPEVSRDEFKDAFYEFFMKWGKGAYTGHEDKYKSPLALFIE